MIDHLPLTDYNSTAIKEIKHCYTIEVSSILQGIIYSVTSQLNQYEMEKAEEMHECLSEVT